MNQFLVLVFFLVLPSTVETSHPMGRRYRYNDRCLDKYNDGEEFDDGYYVKKCVVYDGGWYAVGVACYTLGKKRIEVGSTVDEEGFEYSCIKEDKTLKRSWKQIPPKKCEFTHNGRQYSYHNGDEFLYDQKYYYRCSLSNGQMAYIGTGCYTGKTKLQIGQRTEEGGITYNCIKSGYMEKSYKLYG